MTIPDAPPPLAEPVPDGPIQVSGEVTRPVKVSGPEPRYPEIARKARIQGAVVVEAVINEEGRVTELQVLTGLPMGLTEAAVSAVKQWRFAPATLRGKKVAVYYRLVVKFELG